MKINKLLILVATLASVSATDLHAAVPRHTAPAFWVCNECKTKNRLTTSACAICGKKSPAVEEEEKWFSEFIEKKHEEAAAKDDEAWLQDLLAKEHVREKEQARIAHQEAERQAQAAETARLRQRAEEQLKAERLEQLQRQQEEARREKAAIKAAREAATAEAKEQKDAAKKPAEAAPSTVPLSPRPVGLRNDSGTCFINAMLQCVFSSTRLIDEISVCGSRTPITGMLNTMIEYYYAGTAVPEMLIFLLGEEIRKLFPAGGAARNRGRGGDPYYTYQALAKHIGTINRAFEHKIMPLPLPDRSATPISIKTLIEDYEYSINKKSCILVFCIARHAVGSKTNNKPVILEPIITIDGVRFRLTGFTISTEDHAFTQRISSDGWFLCNDLAIEKITPDFSKGHTQAYMVMYERI